MNFETVQIRFDRVTLILLTQFLYVYLIVKVSCVCKYGSIFHSSEMLCCYHVRLTCTCYKNISRINDLIYPLYGISFHICFNGSNRIYLHNSNIGTQSSGPGSNALTHVSISAYNYMFTSYKNISQFYYSVHGTLSGPISIIK